MPSRSRSSSSRRKRRNSAAKKLQKRVRGKQTRRRHARSIEQIYANLEKTNECAICHEPMAKNEAITKLGCTHRFHSGCLESSMRSGHASCPLCRTVIPNNVYAHLAVPNITYEEALVARNQALQERRNATQAYNDATQDLRNYEQSNRSLRLTGIPSATYNRLVRNQERLGDELRQARQRVTNSMNILSHLSN
uniref:RING-type domain-containing protein n=1 Tax=viral metagenome TaxID=1070528 RepID=A0A6C0D3P0_9ZZZZ